MEEGLEQGQPFVSFIVAQREEGMSAITLPETVFATMMLVVVGAMPREDLMDVLFVLAPQTFAYVFTFAAQFIFTMYVADVAYGGEDACRGNTNRMCLLAGMMIFSAVVLSDLKKTGTLWCWLGAIPEREEEDEDLVRSGTKLLFQRKLVTRSQPPEGEEGLEHFIYRPATGISLKLRVCAAVGCILPKLCLEVVILFSGLRFLLNSPDNESVLMNCLALAFITEIDDIAEAYLITPYLLQMRKSIPPIGFVDSSEEADSGITGCLSAVCGQYMSVTALVVLALVSELVWC